MPDFASAPPQKIDPASLPAWNTTEPTCAPLAETESQEEEEEEEKELEKPDAMKMDALDLMEHINTAMEIEKEKQQKLKKKKEKESAEAAKKMSPFKWNDDLNAKIVLWRGDICSLDIDCIVNTTNERLNDHSGVSGKIHFYAGPELAAQCAASEGCPTGDAIITPAFNLFSKRLIHTVGPRYSVKYQTAAENALHGCYRRSLEVLKDAQLHTIAFPVVNTERKGYPRRPAAHIAMRTVRRFLERFGTGVDLVVLCMSNQADMDIYQKVMPLYFPRNTGEHAVAAAQLPQHLGNELGETVIEERKVRISKLPSATAPVQPTTLDEVKFIQPPSAPGAGGTGVPDAAFLGEEFTGMAEHPDDVRRREDSLKPKAEKAREDADRLYNSYLRRAYEEDLSAMAALNFVYPSGVDSQGRPIIVFVAKQLPATEKDLDKVLLYLIRVLDPIVCRDYNMVYVHTSSTSKNKPPLAWLQLVYNIFNRKYKKNMKRVYIVHPSMWVKVVIWFSKAFVKKKFYKKLRYITMLGELYEDFDQAVLKLPDFCKKYDVKINGDNYERRPKNENSDL